MELLRAAGIEKRFGVTLALNRVDLHLQQGSVHSLLGRNGAGKSTLVNIIAGALKPDRGQIYFGGKDISRTSVAERQALGIRIVTQHAAIIPELDVAENIFVGLWPQRKNRLVMERKKMHALAAEELQRYGLDVSPKVKIKTLPTVEQRKVNIVRALFGGGKLIILDEPTTSLSHDDRDNLFRFIGKLAGEGSSFIFISHYLSEVIRISDYITVIRDGKSFNGYRRGSVCEQQLGAMVVGQNVRLTERRRPALAAEDILCCQDICGANMQGISFSLQKGEVLGIVGFPGSGARSVARALFGLLPTTAGAITLEGCPVALASPQRALQCGISYIPNDRHAEGVVAQLSIRENIGLTIMKTLLSGNFMSAKKETRVAQHYRKKLAIKSNSIEDKLYSLSGGNQQKVVLAKILSARPKVLILDEPTIGIDIQSREEILALVNEISAQGVGVIYLTNDFDELCRISDRFLFFRKGRIVSEMENQNLTTQQIIDIRDNYIESTPKIAFDDR